MSGLYDPQTEHDACGLGFVARLDGRPSRETVRRALTALDNLEHRGATGADADTGDGAGILIQVPHVLMRATAGVPLPAPGDYGVAMCFLPRASPRRAELEELLEGQAREAGLGVLAWRDVPVDPEAAGGHARECAPVMRQLFLAAGDTPPGDPFERRLYLFRRRAELADPDVVIVSCSSRTLVYKGMLSAPQLPGYFADLRDPRLASALAVVHSRFSTNTFPSWQLAHPYRLIAHNGEINTLRGNVNWMRARESALESGELGELGALLPAVRPGSSDSEAFDNVFELLVRAGRSLPHAAMMMVPEAWEGRDDLPPALRDFYEFHAGVMEPWDGPAAIVFSDGRIVGATLDRNGLRPGRWAITDDGWVVLASESGALRLPPEQIVRRGRLQPGALFVVDVERGTVMADRECELEVAGAAPYGRWTRKHSVALEDLPLPDLVPHEHAPARRERLRQAFGYTIEDLRTIVAPTAADGKEPNGSMGNDSALAVLSERRPPLFAYFKQLFAQVTNPAIDPVREDVVMSLRTTVSGYSNVLAAGAEHAHHVVLGTPILDADGFARLRALARPPLRAAVIDATWRAVNGVAGLAAALERIQAEASEQLAGGASVLVLSDRRTSSERVPIPSLLATGAVHQHLVREGTRLGAGLVIDSGEPR
ncbi:MAG: glutamate synthase large chain, partial [Thermoleophilaceae bacterium]|nr:glutamate synthase large chain [Thermoleophilaceae bacterium]